MHHCAAGPFLSSAGQLAITVSGGEAGWGTARTRNRWPSPVVRVEVFDSNGKFLNQWKTYGGVSALFLTKDQHIWVGGFLYDPDGKALGRLPFLKGAVGGGHGMTVSNSGDV